ncbi:uncharacterized protein LOC131154952 [Malania oleifera]|uniref:uncharacterized protein LOC131154952 n=1 Tax=Malania oleifera TaxID=397392 RepID=UPI0025AEC9E0|nr:uncharacterized protein LOC131154952 [Malania oleifera]
MAQWALGRGCRALMASRPSSSPFGSSSVSASTKKKTRNAKVSPNLANFLGAPLPSRSRAASKLMRHVRLNNLQKEEIRCNEKLRTLFNGKDKVGFLEIAKFLSKYFEKSD